jgi:hypothetical protein
MGPETEVPGGTPKFRTFGDTEDLPIATCGDEAGLAGRHRDMPDPLSPDRFSDIDT